MRSSDVMNFIANHFYIYIIIVLAVIGLFFLIREIICWYYKINDIVQLLQSIDSKLDNLQYVKTDNSEKADSNTVQKESIMQPAETQQYCEKRYPRHIKKQRKSILGNIKTILTKKYYL
jgi:hypothetical protein